MTIGTRILKLKVKNEGENEVFQTFDHVHRDPEVFLHHICRDKLSLDSPFNIDILSCLEKGDVTFVSLWGALRTQVLRQKFLI